MSRELEINLECHEYISKPTLSWIGQDRLDQNGTEL